MTVWVEQYPVVQVIAPPIDSPMNVMVMPASFSGDEFTANRTTSPFSDPELLEPGTVPEVGKCLTKLSFLEIDFPRWVVWIRRPSNLEVTLDG